MIKRLLGLLLVVIVIVGYLYFEVNFPKVSYETIESNKIPSGSNLKILQISDLHGQQFSENNRELVKKIRDLNPGIIVITGDLVDFKTLNFERIFSFIDNIIKINPNTYYVTGNHDISNSGTRELIEGLQQRGVTILNNESKLFKKGNLAINICGIEYTFTENKDFYRAFEYTNAELFTILLSHIPDIVNSYNYIPADLILSGHTHGGQISLPILGALYVPGQGFFPDYSKGIYKINNRTSLYIDSGLGTSTIPLRIFDRSQISLITIKGVKNVVQK